MFMYSSCQNTKYNRNIKYLNKWLSYICILAINWFTISVICWFHEIIKRYLHWNFELSKKTTFGAVSVIGTQIDKTSGTIHILLMPQFILLWQKLLITNMMHARDCIVSTVFQGLYCRLRCLYDNKGCFFISPPITQLKFSIRKLDIATFQRYEKMCTFA